MRPFKTCVVAALGALATLGFAVGAPQTAGIVRRVSSEEEFIRETQQNKLVIVDFFAEWCGPCNMIKQPLEILAAKYKKAVFLKVDVDQLQSVADSCEVTAMPTLQLYKDGLVILSSVGSGLSDLETAILEHYHVVDSFSGKGHVLGRAPQAAQSAQSAEGGTSAAGADDPTFAAPQALTSAPAAAESNEPEDGDCELQFRMPYGEPLRRKFYSSDSVEDARAFVATRLPVGFSFRLMTTYPKKYYDGSQLQRTLEEEKLTPRGVLVVSPASS